MASAGLRRRRVASTAARRLVGIPIEAQARLEAGGADVGRGGGRGDRRVQVGRERRVSEHGVHGMGRARARRAMSVLSASGPTSGSTAEASANISQAPRPVASISSRCARRRRKAAKKTAAIACAAAAANIRPGPGSTSPVQSSAAAAASDAIALAATARSAGVRLLEICFLRASLCGRGSSSSRVPGVSSFRSSEAIRSEASSRCAPRSARPPRAGRRRRLADDGLDATQ